MPARSNVESSYERRPMIVGLGTDIIEIHRIADMVERHGENFLNRIYTSDEVTYCQKRKESNQHLAGRWAVKEAVMKALGTGFVKGIHFRDIEVTSERSGKPILLLHGGARDRAEQLGIDQVLISISHCREYATATAIGVGSD